MTDDPTPPPADDLDLLFIRHFSGRMSPEDQRRLDQWLAEDPARAQELERLRWLWAQSSREPIEVDAGAALARFKGWAEIRERELERAGRRAPRFMPPARHNTALWVAAAAALVVAVGAGMLADRFALPAPSDQAVETPPHTFMTARGERARFRLPDGTAVMLGPDSRLEVPTSFRTSTREVRLAGLAFFEVATDSLRPFRVHGGGGTAQVLGTKFSARADSGATDRLEIVVSEGRVALDDESLAGASAIPSGPVLTRGDLGRLTAEGSVDVLRGVDLGARLGWTEGRLEFDRALLSQVLRELETWFDVRFVVADSALAGARLTTTLRNDSMTDMLRLLEAALGADAELTGKTVTLTRSAGSARR